MDDPTAPTHRHLRPLFFIVGCICTVIGIVGVILPLMPGTIFLIIAAACFARSSQKLEAWLLAHPKLGPQVIAWRMTGAIATKVKFIAIGSMIVSYLLIWLSGAPLIARIISGVFLVVSAFFVASRPAPPTAPPED